MESRFSKKEIKGILLTVLFSVIYLLYSHFTIGLKNDQFLLVLFVNVAYILSGIWRRFILAFLIFIAYWIIFDSMKLYPNFRFADVNIENLYMLEKSIFGFHNSTTLITPNEYFIRHHNTVLDCLGAIFYLSWVPVPLIFAFYLFLKFPAEFLRFAFAFFITNIVGFIIYYLYPAAPPWYVELHGFDLDESTKSYAAGLLRFDSFIGWDLFKGMYSKGSNVFAAMPSLHAAYPVIGLFYSYKFGHKKIAVVFFTFVIGIWFSAVYLTHHYILDVIAGLICAMLGIWIFEKVLLQLASVKKYLQRYEALISKKESQ